MPSRSTINTSSADIITHIWKTTKTELSVFSNTTTSTRWEFIRKPYSIVHFYILVDFGYRKKILIENVISNSIILCFSINHHIILI